MKKNSDYEVVLVSPPYMELSLPPYDIPLALTKGCNYMNPGLLISSSILSQNNVRNRIVKIWNPNDIDAIKKCISKDTKLVGISCTCAWEYLESLEIAKIIKSINDNIKIAISGWQIKSIKDKTFEDSKDIDYIILGDAEYTIFELYDRITSNSNEKIFSVYGRTDLYNSNEILHFPKISFPSIDFSAFPNYKAYIPYVEESRNCLYSCKFCLNSCVYDRYQNVPLDIFEKNTESVEQLYGSEANVNLLAANFGVDKAKTKEKLTYLKKKKLKWNIELHVDNPWEYYIDDLNAAGINKVSVGFESGSPKTLELMNKTSNPKKYLERLREMLKELNVQEIYPNLNLLIDYRDNKETLAETLDYLSENRTRINKVKANFMFAFEGLLDGIDYSYNPNVIVDDYGKKIHAYPVLPNEYDLKSMSHIIDEIESGNYSKKMLIK